MVASGKGVGWRSRRRLRGRRAESRAPKNIFDEIYFKNGYILAKKHLTKYLHVCIILPASRESNISKWTWWNGIHSGLKIRRRKAWGFKSPRPHQSVVINRFSPCYPDAVL